MIGKRDGRSAVEVTARTSEGVYTCPQKHSAFANTKMLLSKKCFFKEVISKKNLNTAY